MPTLHTALTINNRTSAEGCPIEVVSSGEKFFVRRVAPARNRTAVHVGGRTSPIVSESELRTDRTILSVLADPAHDLWPCRRAVALERATGPLLPSLFRLRGLEPCRTDVRAGSAVPCC